LTTTFSASEAPAQSVNQPISQAAAVAAMLRITYKFNTDPLSEAAEKMLQANPMVGAKLPLSDPIKIFRNLRRLSKYVDAFEVTDPENQDDCESVKSLWAENQSTITTTLIVNSLAEQLSLEEQLASPVAETPNTVKLIARYGEQLDLVENLIEMSEYEPEVA
jgi:hypothetical protein